MWVRDICSKLYPSPWEEGEHLGHGDCVDSILETKIHIFTHSCCITRYLTLVILHPSLHGSVIKFRMDLWTESQRQKSGIGRSLCAGCSPTGP